MTRPPSRPSATRPAPHESAALAGKVAFLKEGSNYPGKPRKVTSIETHMAWVFLAGEFAYKLKKPVRYPYLDFSTLRARCRDCDEEVLLNRRLAADVYIGVTALKRGPCGKLSLDGEGETVDWLVKMRRMPRDRMLDRALASGDCTPAALDTVGRLLADFYRHAKPVDMPPSKYVERLRSGVEAHRAALSGEQYELPARVVAEVFDAQADFLARGAGLAFQRAADRRIVEGHGDLRPEHICLVQPPVIIDCLEFNREYRLLDPAYELAGLAMECTLLNAPDSGDRLLDIYRREANDEAPTPLLAFYRSHHACLRAKLAAAHLDDRPATRGAHWREQAKRYLAAAHHDAEKAVARLD